MSISGHHSIRIDKTNASDGTSDKRTKLAAPSKLDMVWADLVPMVVTTPTTDGTEPCAVVEAVPCSTSLCCLKLAEEVSLPVVGVLAASQWPSQTVVVNVTPLLTMVVVLVTPGCG